LLKQNRMTSELSTFAARLRERIPPEGRVTRGPDLQNPNQAGDSCNSSLRNHGVFNSLARGLFALQFDHNAAYRRISETRGVTPRSVSHWSQIPAVPAAAFKELELTCLRPEERTHVFHSSGTTEQRSSRHFHNADSLAVYEASLWPPFERHVLGDLKSTNYDLRLTILSPPPARAPHSSLVHMFETVRRKLGAEECAYVGRVARDGSWTLNFEAALTRLRPDSDLGTRNVETLLLGTAFSFVHLLDFLAERDLRLRLPPGSRVMETGGYKSRSRILPKNELHALITERLGVRPSHIVCEYGMSELSSQAYDYSPRATRGTHPDLRVFHFPPWARAQIISPETGREVGDGETGLIRVFDLANVFSVMAIQTEDLGLRRGDGFELIGRVEHAEPRGCSLMAV
jgi:hypothetical protein